MASTKQTHLELIMKSMPRVLVAALFAAVTSYAFAKPVLAADSPETPAPPAPAVPVPIRRWHLDAGLGAAFPIANSVTTSLEMPYRLLLQVDAGWMPPPYSKAIDGFLVALEVYDDTVSQLIQAGLSNSFALRTGAGWRPFERHGFEFSAAYTLLTLGGSLTGAQIINALLADNGSTQRVPDEQGLEVPLAMTLHSFEIRLGWRWPLWKDRLSLRAGLSYFQCFAAKNEIDLNLQGRAGSKVEPELEAGLNQEINDYLNPYLTTYIKSPVVSLGLSYRFF